MRKHFLILMLLTLLPFTAWADGEIVTAPTAVEDLEYNESAQYLVTAGEAADGWTLYYAVVGAGDDNPDAEDYDDAIPQATDAGSYQVFVQARKQGELNVQGSTVPVTISPATPTVNAPQAFSGLSYNGGNQYLIDTDGDTDFGTLLYAVTGANENVAPGTGWSSESSTIMRENAGSYKIWFKVDASGNWNAVVAQSIPVEIAKANATVTYPVAIEGLTYNGGAQNLITGGNTTDGTLSYFVSSSEGTPDADGLGWFPTAQGTNAGTYYLYYKIDGDNNHNDVAPTLFGTVNIAKANAEVTAPEAIEDFTYTGIAQNLFTWGGTTDGTLSYAVTASDVASIAADAENTWYAANADELKRTDAGNYKLWYKLTGDNNHNDVDPTYVGTVSIAKAATNSCTAQPEIAGKTYDGNAVDLTNKGTFTYGTANAVIKFATSATAPADQWTDEAPKGFNNLDLEGKWYYKSVVEDTDNYPAAESEVKSFVISPVTITYFITGTTYNVGDVLDVKNHYSKANGEFSGTEKLADYAEFKFYTTGDQAVPVDNEGRLTTKGTYPVSALRIVWKNDVAHNYDFRFTSTGNIVVAAKSIAAFFTAPAIAEEFTYDGNEKTLTTVPALYMTEEDATNEENALVEGTDYEISYRKNVNAGYAELVYTGLDNYDDELVVNFTINKATITADDFEEPTAISGLSYNATEKTLIKAGTIDASIGSFQYKLGDGDYAAALPKATAAGNYAVTWKIVGSANYNDYTITTPAVTPATDPTVTSEWAVENVKIARAQLVIQPKKAVNALYTGQAPDLDDVEISYTKFYGEDGVANVFGQNEVTLKVANEIATADYPMGEYEDGIEVVVPEVIEGSNYDVFPVNGQLNITAAKIKVELVDWHKEASFGTNAATTTSWTLLKSDKAKLHVLVQNGFDEDGNATYPEVVENYVWPDATTILKTTGTGATAKFSNLTITREAGSDVNDYPVTLSGVTPISDNYEVAENGLTVDEDSYFSILAQNVIVKATNKSKVYGTATDPALKFTVTNGELTPAQKEIIQNAMQRVEGENVGVYEINFKKDITEGDGPSIQGLDITYVVGAFAITPATLTITADDQTLYTGNTVAKLDQNAYDVDGLVEGDDEPVVELSFAEYVPVYSFTSYPTNNPETTYGTGKVKVVSVDAQTNKTTVEVIENNPEDENAADFVGNQYIVNAVDLTAGNTFELYNTDNTETGLSVKNVALVPAESGVKVDADGKLVKVNDQPYVTIEGGINVTVTNAADYAQNYELVVVNGNLKMVNVETTIILSKVNDNTDAIAAANNKLVNVMFEPTENTIIKKEKWYTMVLPFATSVKEISEKFGYAVVDTLNEANNTKNIQLRLHMQDLPANKPFIFKVYQDKNLKDVTFEAKKIIYAENLAADGVCGKDLFGNKFIGTYASKTGFTANQWRMSTSADLDENGNYKYDKWYYGSATNKSTIAPLAAYIESVNAGGDATFNAPIFEIEDLGGTVTIIEGVNLDDVSARNAEGWYTISGIKLDAAPTEKGVYINNGKKVVLK